MEIGIVKYNGQRLDLEFTTESERNRFNENLRSVLEDTFWLRTKGVEHWANPDQIVVARILYSEMYPS